MTEFPKDIIFKYSWRKYQQRVLDELESHLTDDHLHVIAPPGSGKTVLGLEVARRLNKPTLILAPTIAIRNQWIQRFCELFLQTHWAPHWISKDIRKPAFMTVLTYQGLHAACNNLRMEEGETEEEEEMDEHTNGKLASHAVNFDQIISGLKRQNIKTIVVDEAHHLKNEWWQTLTKVKEKLDPVIVGLTATPPYDVSASEWQRYIELNGPVDTEISIPELVLEGDLCPHQDYVYFTVPTEKENKTITEFRKNMDRLWREISTDETLIKAIENHPVWLDPAGHLDWIYNHVSYYSACLIFLHANKKKIPETHIEVVGDKKFKIPVLDHSWMETLLEFYLYQKNEHFKAFGQHQKHFENQLRRYGAIERRQISFSHNTRVTGFLTSSISKLNGIQEIVDFEYQQLGHQLRMVILSDFIRKEFFNHIGADTSELNKIGAVPIFEKLRRENVQGKKIGVLTGTLIIIPRAAYPALALKAAEYGIDHISFSAISYDNEYLEIHQSEKMKHAIVYIITQIFQQGEIQVLIGTKALLGEGWDAPAINSLILASFVGSFVVSNQMRGRAIRTQNGNTEKTGNIWHLVCLDPTSPTGGDDFDLLKRRFRSFVGVSVKEESGIENGINRLNIPEKMHLKDEIRKKNLQTFTYAGNRQSLKQLWKTALQKGVTLVDEIKVPYSGQGTYKKTKKLYHHQTIAYLTGMLGSGLLTFGLDVLQIFGRTARNIKTLQDLYIFLTCMGIMGILIFGRLTYTTFRLYLYYRDISKDIGQIGESLVHSLAMTGAIHTDLSTLQVNSSVDQYGSVYCHLQGGTTFEKSTFINALQEIIRPINNPRYVIQRKSKFMRLIQQQDYHAVPEIIGRNKSSAEYFKNQWERIVGSCELVFTRSIDGRKSLLKARAKSLAAQFNNPVEHVNKWR